MSHKVEGEGDLCAPVRAAARTAFALNCGRSVGCCGCVTLRSVRICEGTYTGQRRYAPGTRFARGPTRRNDEGRACEERPFDGTVVHRRPPPRGHRYVAAPGGSDRGPVPSP